MQSELAPDLLLTRRQVEHVFGLTVRYLEVAAARQEGPPMVKIGRMVRYRVGDIRAWIEAHRVGGGYRSRYFQEA